MLNQKEKLFEKEYEKHIITHRVEADKAYFTNISDIHYGLNDRKLFQSCIEFILSIPNLYIGIGGNAGNGASKISKGNTTKEEI